MQVTPSGRHNCCQLVVEGSTSVQTLSPSEVVPYRVSTPRVLPPWGNGTHAQVSSHTIKTYPEGTSNLPMTLNYVLVQFITISGVHIKR